jgi:hypothetical protein
MQPTYTKVRLPTDATVNVVSDLYCPGRRDDGTEFHAEVYYVQIEFANGERLNHHVRFYGCAVHVSEEDGWNIFEDLREQATARAEYLAQRVREEGVFNPHWWEDADPAYGSDAYIAQGTEYKRWLEERNEG